MHEFLLKCACATDFELCGAIASSVEDEIGYNQLIDPSCGVPVHLRVPFLIWSGQGFAEKEGLLRMLALRFDKVGWADAYELIGLPELAESLRALIGHLPDPFFECDKVETVFQSSGQMVEDAEAKLFKATKEVEGALSGYVRLQLDRYHDLTLAIEVSDGPPVKNIGYLYSAHLWIVSFAQKHDDRIPTFEELKAFTMHVGLKLADPACYSIPLKGRLSEQRHAEPLVVLNRPIFGRTYCVTVAGRIQDWQCDVQQR